MPKASVSVTLTRDTVVLGGELSGILHVTSEKEFDMEELRVQIIGSARARDMGENADLWGKERLWYIMWRVSGPLNLTRGYMQEFPFRVRIPTLPGINFYGLDWSQQLEDTFGSFSYLEKDERVQEWKKAHELLRDGKVEWEIKGVIARRRRLDINSKKIGFKVSLPSSPVPLDQLRPRVEDVQTIYCSICGKPVTPEMRLSGLRNALTAGRAGEKLNNIVALTKEKEAHRIHW